MNFQTMSKQRKMILVAAAIGVISMFLPWVSVFGFSTNGVSGWGIVVLFCFLTAGILSYMDDQTKNLELKNWMLVLIAGGLASLIMVISFFDVFDVLEFLNIGFYGALLASLAVVVFAYLHRSSGATLQSGFDTLKNSFGNGTGITRTDTNPTTKVINPTNDSSNPVL
ncbi:MAG TPA: hypothetical protein VGB71_17860 [Flavisolibacter sp.]